MIAFKYANDDGDRLARIRLDFYLTIDQMVGIVCNEIAIYGSVDDTSRNGMETLIRKGLENHGIEYTSFDMHPRDFGYAIPPDEIKRKARELVTAHF